MARSTHTYSTQAIVLRNRNLGEKDRIMTLLSPEIGKFCAVAKGSRAPKSKLAAVSQPFTFARFLVARGRSLDIATQAEVEQAHTHIAGDLLRTAWATYLCELCDFVPEHQPDEELFDTLRLALERLNVVGASREDVELAGMWFEARFLSILGYAATLGRCVVCSDKIVVAPDEPSRQVPFSAALGGTLCAACAPRDPTRASLLAEALRALHRLERAVQPPSSQNIELTTGARRDLRSSLRGLLAAHLEIRPRSQKFLDEISAEIGTSALS
jgi:DNA repair protein RecO (recombination protein O)